MYRQKRKLLPIMPQSLEEAIDEVNNRNILTNINETFSHVDIESKIIFLITKSNIQFMCHNSSQLFTFSCPKFSY